MKKILLLLMVFFSLPAAADDLAEARRLYDAKDYAAAEKIWRASAESGHPEGQTRIGWIHELGPHRWRSVESAIAWYEKAAAQNHPEAFFALSRVYRDYPGWQDEKKSLSYLGQAAEAGWPEAVMLWADALWFDDGSEQALQEACRWYATAGENPDPFLALGAGRCLMAGIENPLAPGKDREAALRFLTLAEESSEAAVSAEAREHLLFLETETGAVAGAPQLPTLPFQGAKRDPFPLSLRWGQSLLLFEKNGRPKRELPDKDRTAGIQAHFAAVSLGESWLVSRCRNLPDPPKQPKDGEPPIIPHPSDYKEVQCDLVESTPGRAVTFVSLPKGVFPGAMTVEGKTAWFLAGRDLHRMTLGEAGSEKVMTGVVPEPVSPWPLKGHRQAGLIKVPGENLFLIFMEGRLGELRRRYTDARFVSRIDVDQKSVNWSLGDAAPGVYRALSLPGQTVLRFHEDNWLAGFAPVLPSGQGFYGPLVRNRVGCIKVLSTYDVEQDTLDEGHTLKRGIHCK